MLPAVLGSLTRHEHIAEWRQSGLVQVDSLGGHRFRFVFDESVLAEGDLDFSKAIENALRPGLNPGARRDPRVPLLPGHHAVARGRGA